MGEEMAEAKEDSFPARFSWWKLASYLLLGPCCIRKAGNAPAL
jgi:hypothetical protein